MASPTIAGALTLALLPGVGSATDLSRVRLDLEQVKESPGPLYVGEPLELLATTKNKGPRTLTGQFAASAHDTHATFPCQRRIRDLRRSAPSARRSAAGAPFEWRGSLEHGSNRGRRPPERYRPALAAYLRSQLAEMVISPTWYLGEKPDLAVAAEAFLQAHGESPYARHVRDALFDGLRTRVSINQTPSVEREVYKRFALMNAVYVKATKGEAQRRLIELIQRR